MHQVILNFLGMLRSKYLKRLDERDFTFKSVILVGVHDIKNLKLKMGLDEEIRYNSPWNIVDDYNVDLSFSPSEIETMLREFEKFNKVDMNIKEMSKKIYEFTSGYPYIITKICQLIYENKLNWTEDGLKVAVNKLIKEGNTLFDDLVKNLENDSKLYELIESISVNGEHIDYNLYEPVLNRAITFSIVR